MSEAPRRSSAPPRGPRAEVEGLLAAELAHARATAEELRVEKEQLARVLATAPGAFLAFRFDAQGKGTCPYGSAAVREVYGLDPEELKLDAGPVLERIHPDDAEGVQAAIIASGEGLTPYHGEYRYIHPFKGEVWIRVRSIPNREPDGGTLWLGFIEDITDSRRAEELARQQDKMEALETLANGIAHDFNNLLTVMAGNCALAARSLQGHTVAPLLADVEQALGRAAELVSQIQGFGSPKPRADEPTCIAALVQEVVRLQRATLPPGCSIEVEVNGTPREVRGDAGQLHQVVLNLVRNAVQATSGGGKVTVGVHRTVLDDAASASLGTEAAGPHVLLEVRDDGVGMDEATLARVFDPYFTTKVSGEGLGLGLSIVHRVVNHHGGAVAVDSAPDRGATFRVYLPAATSGEG